MKNFLFFLNHIENSISKTLIYYFALITVAISGFLIGSTSNLINNRGEVEIKNKDNSNYEGYYVENASSTDLSYDKNQAESVMDRSVIFASTKGKYFYYKGCGGDTIAKKNLRYYKTEEDAVRAGKKIYKKCE